MSALACKIRVIRNIHVIRNIRVIRNIISLSCSAEDSCHSSNSCSQKNLVFKVPFPHSAENSCHSKYYLPSRAAWNIRVIRVIRVQKNLVFKVPFPRQRGTFVSFELFVFKRKIPCPPVLSRASVEHSCHSSYSCSKEKSRVHKKIIRVPIRMQK